MGAGYEWPQPVRARAITMRVACIMRSKFPQVPRDVDVKAILEQCIKPKHRKMFFWDREEKGYGVAPPKLWTCIVIAAINPNFRVWLYDACGKVEEEDKKEAKVVIPEFMYRALVPGKTQKVNAPLRSATAPPVPGSRPYIHSSTSLKHSPSKKLGSSI